MPGAPPVRNVLLVTADQWRADTLSCAGHPVVHTPNIDRLAASGVRFARHFAQAAPCGPSRASLYTGTYLMNHRSVGNGTPLDARLTNVALEARRLGYSPALFGYTDTSVDPRHVAADDPRLRTYEGVLPGFDPVCHLPEGDPREWLDWLAGNGYEIPDDWRSWADTPAADHPGAPGRGATWAPARYRAEHSQTAFLTDRVLQHLESRGGEPWFVHVSYLRPHPPYLATDPYHDRYDPDTVPEPVRAPTRDAEGAQHPLLAVAIHHPELAAPDAEQDLRQLRATYYGMISEVDDQIGRILDWLDASGQAADTLVVFTSDHGEMLGDHWLVQKLGWFDEAYNVPLVVRDPRAAADSTRGSVVERFTEHVDVMPTILDLLCADVPLQCDGATMRGFLQADPPEAWRAEVHWEFDFRDPETALVEQVFGLRMDECALNVVRDDRYKYVHFTAMPPILFDLAADPSQITNVAADPAYAPVVAEYAGRLLSWRMRNAERTLTGTKLTPTGPVTRRDPA